MDNEREEDDEIDLTIVQRASSVDSLEQNESTGHHLRCIKGYHKWINKNEEIRVENYQQQHDSIQQTPFSMETITKNKKEIEEEEEVDISTSERDLFLNHFDVQLQVNNGQLHQAVRYGVFSSSLLTTTNINAIKINQYSQTMDYMEPEMDMDSNNNGKTNGNHNGYSRQSNENNNDGSYRRNGQANGSSGNGGGGGSGGGNGSNPNRNNNNSRRPNDDGSGDNDDDDGDDSETDENLARRLGFRPIDNETIRIIGRLRHITNKQSFDRQDFENLQFLIDELIRLQHLENSPQDQLEKIVHYFKLHRPLRTKSHALTFIQDRLPRRTVRSNQENNSNVFDIWRERERRARLDSKDSLEEEGQNSSGQQLRDVTEINHPTPPVTLSTTPNGRSKVKQMARDIDTRSVPIHTGDRIRSSSPSPTNPTRISVGIYDNETFIEDRLSSKRNSLSPASSEKRRVRQMIDRLESSSSSSNAKSAKKISSKKSFHEDYSDGSTSFTSSPPVKRITRRESHEKSLINGNNNGGFIFRHKSPHDEIVFRSNNSSNITRFELDREEIINSGRRTASGTTMEEYANSLLPGTETSVSMVREVRARLYEDNSALSRTDVESIPIKVDVETLYILEQKSEKKSLSSPPGANIYIPNYEYNRSPSPDRHDFAMQTTTIKPPHRPIGTQVDSTVEQSTVAAQTTDSLHRPTKERQRLPSSPVEDGEIHKIITTTTTTKYEVKRRHSSHHTSEDEDNAEGGTVIFIDDKENFQLKRHSSIEDELPIVPDQNSSFGQVTSRLRIDQLRDINRNVVRRHFEQNDFNQDEHRSSEVYEIHTRGACKCLVISSEEKTQYGFETRFEKQLKRIERTYTEEELKATELHVIVTSSDGDYQLVRRDYGSDAKQDNDDINGKLTQPTVTIHYYTKEGHRMRTEQARRLEHLPLFIRCEIEYELNHYGSAQLIILSVTNAERRQMNVSVKKEIVDETVSRSGQHSSSHSRELENEISRKLAEPISLSHLVDYSSRDDYNQINSTDLRRVSRTDVTTSLRIVQRYRTVIHRLCQLHRSHLRLTPQAEQQRHLILVARDEYYLLDLSSQTSSIITKQSDTFKQEVHHVPQQPFDYAKYRRDVEQQQRIIEQRYRQKQQQQQQYHGPPPPGHPSEAEFYLGSERRALIEREINSMRESIRPHEHAPPRYKHEPARRSLSISYSGGQRYVRARIIHVKDYYDESQQHQQQKQQQHAKEQELFVRVDDYINESAANSLRRSYSTDYLQEDGPRSRIRYIRIPGETIRIEEKTTYEYQGVMYANLPYSLRYWNILHILDREAREGRPLGSSLPQVIVNDPYRTVIPPLTQQEIRQTAQQVLSPQYNARSYTDQTLRWFLSRDNRTEIESAKYLQTLNQYRHQQQHQQQQKRTNVSVQGGGQQAIAQKYFVTEKLVRYEKMPDRLVPVPVNGRAQSIDNIHYHQPASTSRHVQQSFQAQNHCPRSQSQPRPQYQPSFRVQLPSMHSPLSRHQSVHELHIPSTLSHPPSPTPSLHSLHSNRHHQQHYHHHQRRPVAFNNRYQPRPSSQQPVLTEIIDSQTGRRILTTSQEQLPTEVRGLLDKYNLQQF